jgi:hypothetical protein
VIAVRVVDTAAKVVLTQQRTDAHRPVGADVKTCATLAGAWKYKSAWPISRFLQLQCGWRIQCQYPHSIVQWMVQPFESYGIAA